MTTSATTVTTLTDRYVDATLRRLPGRQRPDIEQELRASIADAVDDRVEAGSDPAEAEEAVLTELGDPSRLAAGYADRPLHLIGPALYLDYTRLLTALVATVVPAAAGAVGLIRIVRGGSVGAAIVDTLGTAITTAVHTVFWTTLFFAVVERTPALRSTPAQPWTPASLPEPPSRRARHGELIVTTALLAVLTTFVLVSPVVSTETDADGDPIGFLSPWLWDTGVVYVFIALAVAGLGFSFAKEYVRWSVPVALAGALTNVASSVVLVWLAGSDRLLNPAFMDVTDWPPAVTQWINIGLVIAAVLSIVHTVIESVAGFTARSWATDSLNTVIRSTVDGITRAVRR